MLLLVKGESYFLSLPYFFPFDIVSFCPGVVWFTLVVVPPGSLEVGSGPGTVPLGKRNGRVPVKRAGCLLLMLFYENTTYAEISNLFSIPIHERVELPEELIPADSRVEIDAKITAGYFTTGHRMTGDELKAVQGRIWEE